jgi:hypothetical protein
MPNLDDRQRYRDILQRLAQYGTLDDPEVAFRLATGLEGFLARWEREVLPFVAAGGAELRFVEGPYGRGKTHFLQALEVSAQRAGFVTSRVECGLQQKPFGSLEETYRVVADNMSLAGAHRNGSGPGLGGILAGLPEAQLANYQSSPRGNPAYRNLVLTYAKRARVGGRHDEVTQSLRALLHHNSNRRVTFRELFEAASQLGVHVPRPMGKISKRNAAVWLRSLLSLPRRLGYKGLVVMFDETGADLSFKSHFGSFGDHQRHLANLRNLVDQLATGGTPGCSVIYATTRDLVEIARQDYPALSQRVERREEMNTFDFPAPNPRAIWCKLDELTYPGPDTDQFFMQLGEKLVGLARDAGISEHRLAAVKAQLPALAKKMSQNLTQAAVREFIKTVAANLVRKE